MDFFAVVLKNLCQRTCQCSCSLFVVPAVRFTAYFNIHHCHRKFCQQSGVSFSVVYARPVGGFCCHMIVLQPQFFSVLFHCQHEISHESGFCCTKHTRGQIPQGMYGQHLFRRMLPFMPCNHAGHIAVRKIFIHIRQIFIVVQTNGCLCRCKIKGIPCLIFIRHYRVSIKNHICFFLQKAFFLQAVPYQIGHISKITIHIDKINSFFPTHRMTFFLLYKY